MQGEDLHETIRNVKTVSALPEVPDPNLLADLDRAINKQKQATLQAQQLSPGKENNNTINTSERKDHQMQAMIATVNDISEKQDDLVNRLATHELQLSKQIRYLAEKQDQILARL